MASSGTRSEDLNHALLVSDRIIQLGGTPVLSPQGWSAVSPCKYDAPEDPCVAVLLDQNIAGEQCAITTYKGLMDATKDMATYNMALTILEQEVEHEEDLHSNLIGLFRTWVVKEPEFFTFQEVRAFPLISKDSPSRTDAGGELLQVVTTSSSRIRSDLTTRRLRVHRPHLQAGHGAPRPACSGCASANHWR